MILIPLLWACVLLVNQPAALASDTSAESDTSAVITFERTMCYGMCPAYTLWIDRSGRVRYEGREWVAVKGVQETKIPQDSVDALILNLLAIDFFNLDDRHWLRAEDAPSTIFALSYGGRTRQVVAAGDPEPLQALARRIDTMISTERWTGVEARRRWSDSLRNMLDFQEHLRRSGR